MKNLALIPARGGSKRLPRKNIKLLNEKPLIQYTIDICLNCPFFDRVIVSTDDKETAEITLACGAEVPFIRPSSLSGDSSGDREIMLHCIDWLKKNENYTFDNLAYMRPTTPFKTENMIEEALKLLKIQLYSSVRCVTKVEGVNHPYWMFNKERGTLKPFINDISTEKYYQSQLLPECFRLNGMVDITRVKTVIENSNIYGDSVGFIEISERYSIDIDTSYEFELCEFILNQKLH